jgi:steroid delta-isomerase-like uncharacterized protein
MKEKALSLEHNKMIVRRQFEELINKKNLAVVDSDMAEDFVDHEAPAVQPAGLDGVKQWIKRVYEGVPDLHVTIEDIVAEGDKVVVRNTWRGTHTGAFMGMAPTGKTFELKGMVMWRLEEGKLKERWATLDHWGLRQQLQPPA